MSDPTAMPAQAPMGFAPPTGGPAGLPVAQPLAGYAPAYPGYPQGGQMPVGQQGFAPPAQDPMGFSPGGYAQPGQMPPPSAATPGYWAAPAAPFQGQSQSPAPMGMPAQASPPYGYSQGGYGAGPAPAADPLAALSAAAGTATAPSRGGRMSTSNGRSGAAGEKRWNRPIRAKQSPTIYIAIAGGAAVLLGLMFIVAFSTNESIVGQQDFTPRTIEGLAIQSNQQVIRIENKSDKPCTLKYMIINGGGGLHGSVVKDGIRGVVIPAGEAKEFQVMGASKGKVDFVYLSTDRGVLSQAPGVIKGPTYEKIETGGKLFN